MIKSPFSERNGALVSLEYSKKVFVIRVFLSKNGIMQGKPGMYVHIMYTCIQADFKYQPSTGELN